MLGSQVAISGKNTMTTSSAMAAAMNIHRPLDTVTSEIYLPRFTSGSWAILHVEHSRMSALVGPPRPRPAPASATARDKCEWEPLLTSRER